MFKIAYGAGHRLATAGKRLPKELDPKQTREWVLNDQVADHFAQAAAQYEGVELLRVDDPEGLKGIDLSARCRAANEWGADFCLAIHHNAGAKLTNAGGIVAFSLKNGTTAAKYRDAIYDACIAAGGLRGNRSSPKTTANFYVLRNTQAPAVLMEYGFMDSKVDYSVILDDDYSKLVAYATMEGIAKVAGLKKKSTASPAPAEKELYRVRKAWDNPSSQLGAFQMLEYAKKACKPGYKVFDSKGNVVYTAYRTHKVVENDTLWDIAVAMLGSGNRYTEIMTLNGLKNTVIYAGQTLRIPEK